MRGYDNSGTADGTNQIFVLSSVVKPLIRESDKPHCEDGESTEPQRLDIGIVGHLQSVHNSQADFSPDILCPFTANSSSCNVIPEITCCEGGNEYSMLGRKDRRRKRRA
jgi:hypothetical protein